MSRKRILILGGACAAVAALWFLLLWGPQGGRLADAEDRQVAAESTNDELQLRLARLQATARREPQLVAAIDQLRTAVPDGPNLPQFILEANDAASAADVAFLSISPSPPAASASPTLPNQIALQITVSGGYEEVLDYLGRLEALPRIVVVDGLTLSPGVDQVTGRQELAVSLTARMFTNALPPTVGAPLDGVTTAPPPSGVVPPTDPAITTSTTADPADVAIAPTSGAPR